MRPQHKPYSGGSIPENYERHRVPLLFQDYARDLASRVDVREQGAVLETACGTGAVTRHLRDHLKQGVRLTVTDLAPPMVELARQIVGDHSDTDYRQADALALPFPDGIFDYVIWQFSIMLFPDKGHAMREAARVLKPGGNFVFNVSDRLERNAFSCAVHQAMAEIFPEDPPTFLQAPYSYYDLTVLTESLQEAGFDVIDITVLPRDSKAMDARQVAAGLVAGSPLANQMEGIPPERPA